MRTVAIYARHSSDKQTTSTDDQISRCQKFCTSNNYQVASVFSDKAISGATPMKYRKGIHQLLDDALDGKFEFIICEDLSRLSRDQGDIAHFFKKLAFLDIGIETVSEGIINELHIGLKGTMNALYLRDLGDKTHRGMVASVLKGSVPGGRTYGYDILDSIKGREFLHGLRKINDKQAEVIQNIFESYLKGHSTHKICQTLNQQGTPSPSGGKWHPSTLIGSHARGTGLLRQTLYMGEITFNRQKYKKHPTSGKRVSVMRPKEEWVKAPAPELAIISEDLFNQAQVCIKQRARQKIAAITTPPEEKKTSARQYMKLWRDKQKQETVRPQYITSRRLHCAHCDEPIAAYKGMTDRCKNRQCKHHQTLKRSDTVSMVEKELFRFNENHLKAYNQEPQTDLLQQKNEAAQMLDQKRQKAQNLLELLATKRKGKESIRFLENLENECFRYQKKIAKIDRVLADMRPLDEKEIAGVVAKFHILLQRYMKYPEDQNIIRRIQKFIIRINITERTLIDVDYDLNQIVKTIR